MKLVHFFGEFSKLEWGAEPSPIRQLRGEIVGSPHPYHLKAGSREYVYQIKHGGQQRSHTSIEVSDWLI